MSEENEYHGKPINGYLTSYLSDDEIELVRQWFNVVDDCHSSMLEKADYKLGLKITKLSKSVPSNSLLRKAG